jgi:hypothetical protein
MFLPYATTNKNIYFGMKEIFWIDIAIVVANYELNWDVQ